MAWRDLLRPASFRGAEFHVETGARQSGRRGSLFEFPKRDIPYFEDMGRAARRWSVAAYVIGPDYTEDADALEAALCAEGPGLLVHPTMGEMRVECINYTRGERRHEGGLASFDMTFVEAGSPISQRFQENTQANVKTGANTMSDAAASDAGNGLKALA